MPEQKVKILIVEDNPVIAEDLSAYMKEFGYEPAGIAVNADEALKLLRQNSADLVLLDVGLEGEIDGIQLALLIRDKFEVPFIFLTAFYDDKTIERIKETRPNAYLVKPIDEHSLKTTLEVVLYNYRNTVSDQPTHIEQEDNFGKEGHFFIKVKQGLIKIQFNDVLFFEAYDNYAYVYTSAERHLISLSLKNIEDRLPSKPFVRVHRSFIVNIEKVQRIDEISLKVGEHSVPIGKTYRADIMKHIHML